MDGRDGNGKPRAFNPEEAAQLRNALCDLSDRIRRCAESIDLQAGGVISPFCLTTGHTCHLWGVAWQEPHHLEER